MMISLYNMGHQSFLPRILSDFLTYATILRSERISCVVAEQTQTIKCLTMVIALHEIDGLGTVCPGRNHRLPSVTLDESVFLRSNRTVVGPNYRILQSGVMIWPCIRHRKFSMDKALINSERLYLLKSKIVSI